VQRDAVAARNRPGLPLLAEHRPTLTYMQSWCTAPRRVAQQIEMRLLLRDYVERLLMTGMRHGTEATRVECQHREWHTDKAGKKYLRLRVSGKTGARCLIAKYEAVGVLERMLRRDAQCQGRTLVAVLPAKLAFRLFRFSTSKQPYHFNAVFRRLLTDCGLLQEGHGEVRTLYSLRHTYAAAELLAGTDIHTLARQVGTSVVVLEQHYSKLSATMAAGRLAG
jgi:integrase